MKKATRQRNAPQELKHVNNHTVRLSQKEVEALNKKASSLGVSKGSLIRKGLQYILNNNQ